MSTAPVPMFLLEIGCEELPDWMIVPSLRHLATQLQALAEKERLGTPVPDPPLLGTPRRLALLTGGLRERQEDRVVEVAGPRIEAAFDAAGKPTRALEGFARSQGVPPEALVRIATAKGECVAARRRETGRSAGDVLASAIPGIIASIPFGKTMRWGEGSFRFARPIQWIVCLFGSETIAFEIAGVRSGRTSRGARFAGSSAIEIEDARRYPELLKQASVVVDFEARRSRITSQVDEACARLGGDLRLDRPPELLETLTGMTEFPVAAAGGFDRSFLALPAAVLSTAMVHHQRFFPVRAADGTLAPHYVAVLNCRPQGTTVETIRRGNEWVLKARLRDADFFWKEDRKRTLESRLADLEKVTFEAALGSYRNKVLRVEKLAEDLCRRLRDAGRPVDGGAVAEAARICKSDLTTLMVKEFPELQGIAGGLYAREEGRPEAVCRALQEQYHGSGGEKARFSTLEAAVLAVADRMDTLAGFFLLEKLPTGSRDPYGLRRSGLALVQATLDQGLDYLLGPLIEGAGALYQAQGVSRKPDGLGKLLPFLEERLRHVALELHGLRYDAVNAALAVGCDRLGDAFRRMQALHAVRGHADFEALSLSYRRVKNILAGQATPPLRESSLGSPEEKTLLGALIDAEKRAEPQLAAGDYDQALRTMASLRSPLDRFFEKVLVMDPDEGLRASRLALLKRISDLFLKVGDLAEMVLEGEGAAEPAGRSGRA